ncbi:MAG: hypothetical protein AAFN78_10225 [Pseudomonadota bacterium]
MKALSEWLLSRRYRAVFGVVMTSLLFQGSSGALLALVTLARGLREGLLVASLSLLAVLAAFVALGVQPEAVLATMLTAWVPIMALAILLGLRGSLALVVQVAVLLVAAVVTLIVLSLGDPTVFWRSMFDDQVIPWMNDNGLPVRVSGEALDALALQMTGFAAGIAMLLTLAHLFLARWMQSLVERPGGFGAEYHDLRMGLVVGVLAGLAFTLNAIVNVAIVQNVAWVFIAAFYLQGLAVVHSIVATLDAGRVWLVVLYVFMALQFPIVAVLLAGLGFVDNWTDLRARVRRTSDD